MGACASHPQPPTQETPRNAPYSCPSVEDSERPCPDFGPGTPTDSDDGDDSDVGDDSNDGDDSDDGDDGDDSYDGDDSDDGDDSYDSESNSRFIDHRGNIRHIKARVDPYNLVGEKFKDKDGCKVLFYGLKGKRHNLFCVRYENNNIDTFYKKIFFEKFQKIIQHKTETYSISEPDKSKLLSYIDKDVLIWWEGENRCFPGVLVEFKNNLFIVKYDDGDCFAYEPHVFQNILREINPCGICCKHISNDKQVNMKCGHNNYCSDCMMRWVKTNPSCPSCRKEINQTGVVYEFS